MPNIDEMTFGEMEEEHLKSYKNIVNLILKGNKMKVIYNDCYGGFGLSIEATKELAKQLHPDAEIKVIENKYGFKYVKIDEEYFSDDLPRHSKLLVDMFEKHGSDWMSGRHANLEIHELSGNKYIIKEYDGAEEVVEPSDIEWIEVDGDR